MTLEQEKRLSATCGNFRVFDDVAQCLLAPLESAAQTMLEDNFSYKIEKKRIIYNISRICH